MDQDQRGWKSWKLTARTIRPTPSLFVAQRPSIYSQGTWGNFGKTRSGWEKVACWSTKAAISLKRVKIEEKLLWGAYRNSPTLFPTVPSPTPYGLIFPKIGGSQPPHKTSIAIIQRTGKATDFKFCTHIHKIDRNKSPLKISGKVTVGVLKDSWNFSGHPYIGASHGHLCDSSAFLLHLLPMETGMNILYNSTIYLLSVLNWLMTSQLHHMACHESLVKRNMLSFEEKVLTRNLRKCKRFSAWRLFEESAKKNWKPVENQVT